MSQFTSEWYAAQLARRNPQKNAAGGVMSKEDQPEEKIQREIAQHLAALGRGIYAVWHRMDMPTTCQVGTPDFVGFYQGRPFAIEVKTKTGKPTSDQLGQLHLAYLAGAKTVIVRSKQEAVEFLDGLNKLP